MHGITGNSAHSAKTSGVVGLADFGLGSYDIIDTLNMTYNAYSRKS